MITNNLPTTLSASERILYAAMQIISENGLKGLSASKLANMAHISKSTVFHYFKKMDDIPALILEKLYSEIITPIQEQDFDNVYAYLSALGTASFSDNAHHIIIYKAFLSLYEASMHDPGLHQIVAECSHEFSLILSAKLQSLSPKPVNEVLLRDLTHLIFMSLDGIGLHYLIHGDRLKAQTAWELLIKSLVSQYHLD
ncbi:TetR/AcrR family transcriptional regulator [Cellulosilyticum sp. I15G10I2]|uniref:TetR/AcrR family transcriptional regulator n=1 Tax=Cellulosilyticum sp. I15G10I2 TaxID=1892843 RepID=UPI00085CD0F6|nr:TetR/AcrR family transcriptional regulator [Cellulosilyticum sp. I15G10I2]